MTTSSPRWSVVVAAYRSDSVIRECLEALREQTVSDLEVIVVNSSPEDRTRQIVSDFPEFRLIESPNEPPMMRGCELVSILPFPDSVDRFRRRAASLAACESTAAPC